MAKPAVRAATPGDLGAIAIVAHATGQDEEWAGADPAYVRHLLEYGQLVVAEDDTSVVGFGATRRIGTGDAAVSMLCDLFVLPQAHGTGIGRTMLQALWRDAPRRMTFSSLHPHALPLYTRFGLDAWWPLLYLAGDVRTLPAPDGWTIRPATAEQAGQLELAWTAADRTADHRAWAARPHGQSVVADQGRRGMAAGTVAGSGSEFGVVHLALRPGVSDAQARDAVVAVLASLEPPGRTARVCLPAPHPATRPLFAAGWRHEATDLFMATQPDLLSPRRAVPSPAMA